MMKICIFFVAVSAFAQPIHRYGFENFPDEHNFTQANWAAQGFTVPWVLGFNNNRCQVDDAFAAEGSKSLRVRYDANTFGFTNNGAHAPIVVQNHPELYSAYWLRFSNNFSWGSSNEGGKLPGLSGGALCSGCITCTGTNGFTARLMWRPGGRGVIYLYHMDKTTSCAPDIILRNPDNSTFMFQKGVWYRIVQRVKINNVGQSNGEVEVFINGERARLVTGLRFVTNSDQVNTFYFATFHGGSDATWAPTVTCHAWFDDIIISANRNDVLGPLSVDSHNPKNQIQENKKFCFVDDGILYVDLPEYKRVTLLDQFGRVLASSESKNINVSMFPMGAYIVRVETETEFLTQKVVLNQSF